jgi:hypothetical protein
VAANNQVTVTAGIASSSTSTGSLVVTGGIGASGTVNAATVAATTLTGTVSTAAQPNITSVGTLSSVNITGNVGVGTTSPTYKVQSVGNMAALAANTIGPVEIVAGANNFFSTPSFAGSVLRYNGPDATGTSFGISNVNLSSLILQNCNNGLIGTNGGAPLIFGTVSAERVRIDTAGNVGIGTSNPGARIETFQTTGGTVAVRMNTNFANGNLVDLNPFIAGVNNGGYSVTVGSNIRQVIDTAGNTGMGTTSPLSRLHVRKEDQALGFDAGLWIQSNPGNGSAGRGGGITFHNLDVYTAGIYAIRQTESWNGALTFYTHTSASGNTFGTTFTEKMRIDSDGRVTTPFQPHIFGTPGRTTSGNSGIATQFAVLSSRGGLTFSNDRITVPITGVYMIFFQTILTSGSGRIDTNILVNGGSRSNGLNETNTSGFRMRTHTITTLLQAGDFIQFNSGSWYVGAGAFDAWQVASVDLIA